MGDWDEMGWDGWDDFFVGWKVEGTVSRLKASLRSFFWYHRFYVLWGSEVNLQLYKSIFFQKLQGIQCCLKRVWNFVDTIKPSNAFVPDCQVRKRSYSAGITGCGVPAVLSGLIKESPLQRSHRGVEIERTGIDWWIRKVLITNYKVQIWHWWFVMITTGFFVPFLQVFQDPKKKLQEVLPGDPSSLPEWLKTFAVTWPRYNEIRLVALIVCLVKRTFEHLPTGWWWRKFDKKQPFFFCFWVTSFIYNLSLHAFFFFEKEIGANRVPDGTEERKVQTCVAAVGMPAVDPGS